MMRTILALLETLFIAACAVGSTLCGGIALVNWYLGDDWTFPAFVALWGSMLSRDQ